MTDEARIARLTELARRVWPEHKDVHVTRAGNYLRAVTLEPNMRVLLSVSHARPYDALEAALLVLAGETSLRAIERAGLPRTTNEVQRRAEDAEAKLAEAMEAFTQQEQVTHEHLESHLYTQRLLQAAEAKLAKVRARVEAYGVITSGDLADILDGEPCE